MRDREKTLFLAEQTASLNHTTIFQACLLNTGFVNGYYILIGADFVYIERVIYLLCGRGMVCVCMGSYNFLNHSTKCCESSKAKMTVFGSLFSTK